MHTLHFHKPVRAVSLLAAAFAIAASSFAQVSPMDRPGWYASGSVAKAVSAHGGGPDVTLLGVRPLAIQGTTDYGDGYSLGLSIGRQFPLERSQSEPLHVRLEGELWHGDVDRDLVRLGQLSRTDAGSVRAQVLFLNGLVRFASTENSRWWVGLGVGYGQVKVPAMGGVTLTGCNCLGADTASGAAVRAKIQGERPLSNDSTIFVELGYTRLPSGSVANASSVTRYGGLGVGQVGVGLRTRF